MTAPGSFLVPYIFLKSFIYQTSWNSAVANGLVAEILTTKRNQLNLWSFLKIVCLYYLLHGLLQAVERMDKKLLYLEPQKLSDAMYVLCPSQPVFSWTTTYL